MLRPRYSLLTLLILTVLVAGGVKLWYGPRCVGMNEPLAEGERGVLMPLLKWVDYFSSLNCRYEVERFRDWHGDRILAVRLIPGKELTIYLYDTYDSEGHGLLVTPAMQEVCGNLLKQKNVVSWSSERVCCMMHPGRVVAREEFETMWGSPNLNPLYALTDQRRIYELNQFQNGGVDFRKLNPQDILDPDLRAQIAVELDRIPRPLTKH